MAATGVGTAVCVAAEGAAASGGTNVCVEQKGQQLVVEQPKHNVGYLRKKLH